MEFPQTVSESIGYYVYALIDPRNDEIFYIGKGNGNRIFNHVESAISSYDSSRKLNRIREILKSNLEVKHIILRHGLTEDESFEIESCCIDLIGLDKLTNEVSGHDSESRGIMTVDEIMMQYDLQPAKIEEPAIIININKKFAKGMT
ncbi:MAG: GIY-YIG nuclease family protein, partial [Bacteroidetes bacterium]|nr:GIY-YIG nuclease family protein [Bacteroidota bacterium]